VVVEKDGDDEDGEDNDNFFLDTFAKIKIELLLLARTNNNNNNDVNNSNNTVVKTLGAAAEALVLFVTKNYPSSTVKHILFELKLTKLINRRLVIVVV
jgi:hypothetical protein